MKNRITARVRLFDPDNRLLLVKAREATPGLSLVATDVTLRVPADQRGVRRP